MLPSDIAAVLIWWFVLFVLGVGFLPLTMLLFSRFFDKGYIFSKLLGTVITAYTVYLLGIARIVPFNQTSSFMVLLLLAGLCYYLARKKIQLKQWFKSTWKIFLAEEIFFLAALLFWSYIHSFAPDIHGLEKYMDFGFINSILRAEYFPPKDMWFTPHSINYYYFGHYITAFLTKLSNLPSYLTYNIMMCSIFAFCLTQTFSIGANLYLYSRKDLKLSKFKLVIAGLFTGILTTFAGNLHILYGFFSKYDTEKPPVPFWTLPFRPFDFPNEYWYPNATRFIYHTIHEFPMYSWTVADLHGHVMDIPFVLLTVALLFSIFIYSNEQKKEHLMTHPGFLVLLGFLISVMYMTNAWDGGIYLLLIAFVLFSIQWHRVVEKQRDWIIPLIKKWFLSLVVVVGAFVIFVFPYSSNFNVNKLVSGVGVLCAPKSLTDIGNIGPLIFEADHCQRSTWWELFTLYGFFYFFVFVFLVFLLRTKKILLTDIFILLLIMLGTLLILIPEFFYMKDIYPGHYRANTMFKLVFQSFILLSISSGYIIIRILTLSDKGSGIVRRIIVPYVFFLPISLVLCTTVLLYPSTAIHSYYGNLETEYSLNGISYLQNTSPTDFAGIQWLNMYVKGQPVILEAQGDSYTDYARVSSNTGLPTILGWTVHEWLWRGSYDVPAPRITEIKEMYETKDTEKVKKLLKKYEVKYVFLGKLEYEKYPTLDEAKFAKLGKIVYQNGQTKIYHLNSL